MAAKKKPVRRVLEIHPCGAKWKLTQHGRTFEYLFDTQEIAIAAAHRKRAAYQRSQIRVFGTDGKIRTEWTYGDDPIETKG